MFILPVLLSVPIYKFATDVILLMKMNNSNDDGTHPSTSILICLFVLFFNGPISDIIEYYVMTCICVDL